MKKLSLVLSLIFVLLSVLSCENSKVTETASELGNSKIINVIDGTNKGSVKLKITAEDPEILTGYSDKSFTLSFKKPANSMPTMENTVNGIENKGGDVVNIEIMDAILPEGAEGILLSYASKSNARMNAARMVTVNLYAYSPSNFIWIYNKSTASMKVAFSYKKTTSSALVSAGTKTLNPRGEAEYCKMSVAQLKAELTYDANAGSYSYFTWNYSKCP